MKIFILPKYFTDLQDSILGFYDLLPAIDIKRRQKQMKTAKKSCSDIFAVQYIIVNEGKEWLYFTNQEQTISTLSTGDLELNCSPIFS